MKLLIESADSRYAKTIIEPAIDKRTITVEYVEDYVGFGDVNNALVIGMVFVFESIISGITWDFIKSEIVKILGKFSKSQVEKTSIYIKIKSKSTRYKVKIESIDGKIDIKMPDGLVVKLK